MTPAQEQSVVASLEQISKTLAQIGTILKGIQQAVQPSPFRGSK